MNVKTMQGMKIAFVTVVGVVICHVVDCDFF